jgi:hypothetical protein
MSVIPIPSKRALSALLLSSTIIAGAFSVTGAANAIPLLEAPGPDSVFGTLAMNRNDDGSSNELTLPFEINFFGNTFNSFFINNNGNVTFNSPDGTFTPEPFPVAGAPRIAPYWGDVDTGCLTCGEVYVGSPNADTTIVTWNNVGFFSQDSSLTNNFQLVLRNRDDIAAGDFDIEFRYDRLEWTTGDASGGTNGLGGTPAQAGFDAGIGVGGGSEGGGSEGGGEELPSLAAATTTAPVTFFTLPGSRTAAVLDLQNTSNVSPETPGLWSFAIREGAVPGETPENPLIPVVTEDGFNFDFNVQLGQQIFIDPVIAVGYDYVVNSGPNFQTVLLPTIAGDDGIYTLFGFDGTDFTIPLGELLAGELFDFGTGGVAAFRVVGIDLAALLDPLNPVAFVTGLTFVDEGQVNMTQTPLTFNTDAVPEPSSMAMLLLPGAILLAAARRRRSRTA